jgi:hypothetical protein
MGVKLTDFGTKNMTAKDMKTKSLTVIVDGSFVKDYDSKTDDGREYVKHVPVLKVHYQNDKITEYKDFVLNRENRERISRTGIIDLDALIGASIEIEKVFVNFKNNEVAALRIGKITLPS